MTKQPGKTGSRKLAVAKPSDDNASRAKIGEPSPRSEAMPEALLPLATPKPLSLKEKNVLEFLENYIRENGVSPTYQEICNHFGFASFNSVQRYLKQLEIKGYIQLPWANQKRAITILNPSNSMQSSLSSTGARHNSDSLTPAIMPTESLSLPLLGRVAAGAPIEALEHDEFIEVPSSLVRHADRTYALRVQGQSMIDDGILDGDVILVQRQSTAQNGEIVVAMVGGQDGEGSEATVKRFYMHRGSKNIPQEAIEAVFERLGMTNEIDEMGEHSDRATLAMRSPTTLIELRPANSTMSPMWYDPGEVQIRGIVVGLIRRFF